MMSSLKGFTVVKDWQCFSAGPQTGGKRWRAPAAIEPSSSSSPPPSSSPRGLSSSSCRWPSACSPCTSGTCWFPAGGWFPPRPPDGSWSAGSWCLRRVWGGRFPFLWTRPLPSARQPWDRRPLRCWPCLLWAAGCPGSRPCELHAAARAATCASWSPAASGPYHASAERESLNASWNRQTTGFRITQI